MYWYDPERQALINDPNYEEIMNKRRERGEAIPEKPTPLPANIPILELINRYNGIFSNGMGGINAEGIRLVLDCEMIDEDMRRLLVMKIVKFMTAAMTAGKKDK